MIVSNWFRCDEYAFLRRDQTSPLGKELVWIENGVSYVLKVPDVPVREDYGYKIISLQKAKGIGVISSIYKLGRERVDDNRYVVSVGRAFNPEADVRHVSNHSYEFYFPVLFSPYNVPVDGWKVDKKRFDKNATGWYGSVGMQINHYILDQHVPTCVVYAAVPWSKESMVAVVNREIATQSDVIPLCLASNATAGVRQLSSGY